MPFGVVQHDANGQRKWRVSDSAQVIGQFLDPRLVAHGWVGQGSAGPGLGGIYPPLAVDLVKLLRLGIVRLEIVIAQRPGW